ncbi:MAG: enoyl-[acyl-carrier-protein] reductase [Deltaproteobacteria bacterium RIFCSPLOWO2_02_FULL_57_26]|nr:MAG: enoyl-[acyl-carrier-protein] reductase [Deltaproteobacteria bacterium RIFCSPLOWO2_02_FULL_57_26]OGQ73598.1 MAG: enoyl-[acyl-carrier-protein] reductase [Deltaproteobacteria bacterium RIFCSPLOWO2_12_FULL_57_22]
MEGSVALVTGGSRGIGKAISLRLAKAKARLLINFFQNRTEAEKTAEDIVSLGAEVRLFQADLKDETQIRAMFGEVDTHYGRLDVLVHSAASGVLRSIVDLTAKQWDWVMNTNVRSFLLCAREAASRMHEGGRIIALSSIGSNRVIPEYGIIGISKAAVESLTRYLAVELAPKGISVNAISAGAVPTDVWNLVPDRQEILERVRQRTPCGRLLTAEEIAEFVYFLSGPHARMIQGQVIVLDGGYTLPA